MRPIGFARRDRKSELIWRFVTCVLVILVAVKFSVDCSDAQQIPNISTSQIQQFQQQIQGQAQGVSNQSVVPQQTILEPNAPQNPQLQHSRLEQILSVRAGTKLRQFGYDQLGVGRPVSLPQVGAVQDNYILGSGDEIVVSLRGQENAEYRTQVDRDGMVTLPRLSPISAAGRMLGEFRRDLVNAIHRAYVATEGYVTVGRLRQINVVVSGEVNSPGVRTLTGLSTPVDAILISGGIKKTGSLRSIYILRGGRRITVDLYSVLTGHGGLAHLSLTDGDQLVVPPLGPTAAVTGWVRRPGIYEIANGRTSISVRALLSLAGGLEVRGRYRLSVLRVASDGRNQMTALKGEVGSVEDSDILFVQPAADQTANQATLSGGTPLAGQYATKNTKLSEILKAPGALGANPYTLFGVISRRDPATLMRTLIAFTPVAVLKGSEDMDVQGGDIWRVISAREARILFGTLQRYQNLRQFSEEALRNPQAVPPPALNGKESGIAAAALSVGQAPSGDQAARQALAQAEADQEVADDTNFGQYTAPQSLYQTQSQNPDQMQSQIPLQLQTQHQQELINMNKLQSSNQPPGPITSQSADQFQSSYQTQSPYQVQPLYQNQEQPMAPNLEEEPAALGQAPSNRDVVRLSQLAAQLHIDPLVLVNFLQDHSVNVDGAVRGAGLYFVGPDADLSSLLMAAGGVESWADKNSIEVISTSVDSNTGRSQTDRKTVSLADATGADYIVSPHDEVRVDKVFTDVGIGSVAVQGQVRHVGTYQIVRGEHLSDLLMRAGGLTDSAYPYGTVFLRRSAAEREQDAFRREASEIEEQLLQGMSSRDPSAKITPDAFTAMQSYVDELRNQKALGRVTIVADPTVLAAHPAMDPLLEPGDVVYVPQRPYGVSVLGQVLQPGSVPFRPDMTAADYIDQAGGYSQFANKDETFLVLPDGSARRIETSWLDFSSNEIPPGSTIFVSRDISGIDLHQIIVDTTQIFSQLATSAAALAVLSKQ